MDSGPFQEAEKEAKSVRLQFEKSKLVAKMMEIITTFDDELEDLRMEKFRLEVNMKCADIKTLVLYQVYFFYSEDRFYLQCKCGVP